MSFLDTIRIIIIVTMIILIVMHAREQKKHTKIITEALKKIDKSNEELNQLSGTLRERTKEIRKMQV